MLYSLWLFPLLLVLTQNKCCEIDQFYTNITVYGGNEANVLNEITTSDIRTCMIAGQALAHEQWLHDEFLPHQGIYLKRNDTGYFRYNTGVLPKQVAQLKYASLVVIQGLKIFINNYRRRYSLSPKRLMKLLYKKKFRIAGLQLCSEYESNDCEYEYRSYDGSGNNIIHPTWGMTFSTYRRLLGPNYADGIHKPMQLPSAREISVEIFSSQIKEDRKLTLIASEIAQLIAHDCTMILVDNTENGPIQCCTSSGRHEIPSYLKHSSCMSIPMDNDDPYFANFDQRYMPFVRSITAPKEEGFLEPPEQINGVSSYLDCNFLYGSSKIKANSLRTFRAGKLLEEKSMLPYANSTVCDVRCPYEICYKAGDDRVNQNPHLVAMQIVFLREHNRLATNLSKLNPHWNDERIYQEARRIVIAIYQHIIYREYLPLVLGYSYTELLFATQDNDGYTWNYDENVDAGCINSLSIIFRCYHATIPHTISTYNENCELLSQYNFSDQLLRPALCESNYDEILNSFSCSSMIKMSSALTPEITNKLFKSQAPFGLDLMATDIQRGRDHGIPSYNQFRRICRLQQVEKFSELSTEMSYKNIEKLQMCYRHVNDIDLLIGGMLEKHVKGTQFGPTILYILQKQFYNLMAGDRFFYTNRYQPYPFTPKQLKEIQKATLAHLICNNGNEITKIQPNVFEKVSKSNPRTKCCCLPKINLQPWKEDL